MGIREYMRTFGLTRRTALTGLAGASAVAALPRKAKAAPTKITFLTSWFAEAEHGGFYQAKALGLYEKAGLDVTIKMGGPQVNGMQLLTGGAADIVVGYDIQVLKSIENGLPVTTIGACFQFDLQGVMTHADVPSIAALKGHKVLIAASSHQTYWPWLKQRFGFTDDMAGVDTFNLQPFLLDKTLAMQGYPSSEPFEAAQMKEPVNFYLFADAGYPPYGTTMVTTNAFLEKNPEAAAAFVKASLEGWAEYLKNPAPGNRLIKIDNPKMPDDQIAFAVDWMVKNHVLDRGGVAIGSMTEARWQATRDFLVQANLLKPDVPWKKAFTTKYVDGLNIRL
jgi:NitT/TauT family transport system substrate-binding protein